MKFFSRSKAKPSDDLDFIEARRSQADHAMVEAIHGLRLIIIDIMNDQNKRIERLERRIDEMDLDKSDKGLAG